MLGRLFGHVDDQPKGFGQIKHVAIGGGREIQHHTRAFGLGPNAHPLHQAANIEALGALVAGPVDVYEQARVLAPFVQEANLVRGRLGHVHDDARGIGGTVALDLADARWPACCAQGRHDHVVARLRARRARRAR